MRVLCDVHLPYRLVSLLRARGIDATHVNKILGGSKSTDSEIAAHVDAKDMVLITKDGDFRDSHLLRGTPTRVLRVTLGNLSNDELIALIEAHWEALTQIFGMTSFYAELSREGIIVFREPGQA